MSEQARGINTIALIRPTAALGRASRRSDAGHDASPSASDDPTFREMVSEVIPLVDAIAGYGPPVIFLAAPWLLLGLMLSGPFASLVLLVVLMLVAAAVVAALTAAMLAIVVAPYALVRRLRGHRALHALSDDHAALVLPVDSPRVVA